MDWNGNLRSAFVPPRLDNNFFYNYDYNQFPVTDTKHSVQAPHAAIPIMDKNNYGKKKEIKKRLTRNQVKALENSFQEEMKLEPDRKMELAEELGLQPREIAIWFQNRRARWKAKQLEHLYDSLKQEFDVVSKEKQKLQEEVLALRGILKEQAAKKQVSTGYTTKVSWEETIESTSVPSSNKPRGTINNQMECEDAFNVDDYNSVMQPYWIGLPSFQWGILRI